MRKLFTATYAAKEGAIRRTMEMELGCTAGMGANGCVFWHDD